MKYLKTLVGAAALAVASFNVSAAPVTVGGVTWDPDSAIDFRAGIEFVQDFNGDPLVAGTELFGFGRIFSINNMFNFCSGCELTFEFSGFETDGQGGFVNNKGSIRVYSDNTPDYDFTGDAFNSYTAANGLLWLELKARDVDFLSRQPNAANPYTSGFLSVTWLLGDITAAAYGNFVPGNQPGGSDAVSDTSATFGINTIGAVGNGNIFSQTIPEPTSIALLGLGLLGLVGGRRFKKV